MTRYIQDYIELVRSGTVPVCRDQLLLVDYVERVFQEESIYVDEAQLERYMDQQKYFPYRLLEWETFCFALHNCVYKAPGRLRWPILIIVVGRGAGKNGYLAFEDFCLITPINGIEKYNIDMFANSEDQAKATFDDIYDILESDKRYFEKYFTWNKEQIVNRKTKSRIKYYTRAPNSKDGGRPGNAYHCPPCLLRGDVTNQDEAVQNLLTFGVKPAVLTVENEANRKQYGREILNGWRIRIDMTHVRVVDIFDVAVKLDNPEQMAEAMTAFFDGMNEAVLQKAAEEIDARNQDAAILSARGANVLTADERAYYEGLAAALKASDPRAAVANYEVAMPQTVIERIIGTIKKTHPLLDKLNFVSTAYLSRILVNAKPAQLATWGKITGAVQKEIEGGVQEIALTMCKLSAFLCISMDLVELGPEWMDAYARETLSEAIACACEAGAVAGTGKDEPIGMIRDMAADVSPTTGYAKQTPVKVKKLDPATMGALLKKLARDPNDSTGKTARVVDPRDVIVVFNPFDYWEKVFAATTLLVGGQYVTNVLPIPAEIFQSSALEQGEAVIGIATYYFIGVGPSGKQGTIIPDDSVKFLEDQRAYKAKLQGNGCPMDKYAFLLLDVSELESIVSTIVEVAGTVSTTVTNTVNTKAQTG